MVSRIIVQKRSVPFLRESAIMAEKKRAPNKPESDTAKKAEKKAETVLLSPEELKKISGGGQVAPPKVSPSNEVHRK